MAQPPIQPSRLQPKKRSCISPECRAFTVKQSTQINHETHERDEIQVHPFRVVRVFRGKQHQSIQQASASQFNDEPAGADAWRSHVHSLQPKKPRIDTDEHGSKRVRHLCRSVLICGSISSTSCRIQKSTKLESCSDSQFNDEPAGADAWRSHLHSPPVSSLQPTATNPTGSSPADRYQTAHAYKSSSYSNPHGPTTPAPCEYPSPPATDESRRNVETYAK